MSKVYEKVSSGPGTLYFVESSAKTSEDEEPLMLVMDGESLRDMEARVSCSVLERCDQLDERIRDLNADLQQIRQRLDFLELPWYSRILGHGRLGPRHD